MIETIETAYLPLLKRDGPPPSTGWSWKNRESSQSPSSSSYGTLAGEPGSSRTETHDADLGRIDRGVLVREGDEKDGEDCRTSPPSGGLPPMIRRSFSDGWSRRSHSSRPPRQKYPIMHQNAKFPVVASGGEGGGRDGGGNIGINLHASVQFTALQESPPEERSSGGRHRRTYSHDVPRRSGGHSRGGRGADSSYFSEHTLNSESFKHMPDPRWGGFTSSPPPSARSRTFSWSSQQSMSSNIVSYSTSTDSGCDPLGAGIPGFEWGGSGYYGSTSNAPSDYGPSEEHSPLPKRHRHHTYSEVSNASSANASFVSYDRSVEPVMTDMTKSAMFKGITNMGVVKFQLPKDNFRLLIDQDLEAGCVYRRALVKNEDDYFQDYHHTIDDGGFEAKTFPPQLPPSYYVMAVDSDIYQRMFNEVSESMNMPCGLFYFGHHADVEYPSIAIAVVGVTIVFSLMLWATFHVDG